MALHRSEYDYLCKVILIGESGSGKTSVLGRFVDDAFTESFLSTIGVDFKIKTVTLNNGKVMKLQVWDTSGQERFRSITRSYYHNAHAAIVVYDVSSLESFQAVPSWLDEVAKNCTGSTIVMLLGNKSDLANTREVQHSSVEQFVQEQHIPLFYEVSAKTGSNIDNAFAAMAERYEATLTQSALSSDSKNSNIRIGQSMLSQKSTCC